MPASTIEDLQGDIRSKYDTSLKEKAAEMFIDAIIRSNDETKWSVFRDVLEQCERLELIKDILYNGVTESLIKHDADQTNLELKRVDLLDSFESDVVSNRLLQEGLLSRQEFEEVSATNRQKGNSKANFDILEMVVRRKDFHSRLLNILWELGYRDVVRRIDQDYVLKLEANSEDKIDPKTDLSISDSENGGYDDNKLSDDDRFCQGEDSSGETRVNAIGFYSPQASSDLFAVANSDKISNMDMERCNVTMFTPFTANNLNNPDDGPIASRTRSKTRLFQVNDANETILKEPEANVPELRAPTPRAPANTNERTQHLINSHSSSSHRHQQPLSRQQPERQQYPAPRSGAPACTSKQVKEAAAQADMNATDILIPDQHPVIKEQHIVYDKADEQGGETILKPEIDRSKRHDKKNAKTLEEQQSVLKNKKEAGQKSIHDNRHLWRNLKLCPCGKRLVSEEELKKHQETNCKLVQLPSHIKHTLQEPSSDKLHRHAKSDNVPYDNFYRESHVARHQRQVECEKSQKRVHFQEQTRIVHTDHHKKLVTDSEMKLDKRIENSKKTALIKEEDTGQDLIACVCGKRCVSRDGLREHQLKNCPQSQFNRPAKDEVAKINEDKYSTAAKIKYVEPEQTVVHTIADSSRGTENRVCCCGTLFDSSELMIIHRTRKGCAKKQQKQPLDKHLSYIPEDLIRTEENEASPGVRYGFSLKKEVIKSHEPILLNPQNMTHSERAENSKKTPRFEEIKICQATKVSPKNTPAETCINKNHCDRGSVKKIAESSKSTIPTKQKPSESNCGFGFQSPRTLQLHMKSSLTGDPNS